MRAAAILLAAIGLTIATPAEAKLTYDNDGRTTQAGNHRHAGHRHDQDSRKHTRRVRDHSRRAVVARKVGVSLTGVVPELAIKVREIVAECGSTVVSAVAGRGNKSNHPKGKDGWGRAADLSGNPRCIYSKLVAWPGGVSTDYNSVMCPTKRGWQRCPHVHISYNPNGQEWGRRFAHRNPFRREARVAQ
jgi:hypothetical protein